MIPGRRGHPLTRTPRSPAAGAHQDTAHGDSCPGDRFLSGGRHHARCAGRRLRLGGSTLDLGNRGRGVTVRNCHLLQNLVYLKDSPGPSSRRTSIIGGRSASVPEANLRVLGNRFMARARTAHNCSPETLASDNYFDHASRIYSTSRSPSTARRDQFVETRAPAHRFVLESI
jgi:hypothetical protein